MKWICWPSMSVRKCGQRLKRSSCARQSNLFASTRRDPAGTRGRCRSPSRCPGSGRASACGRAGRGGRRAPLRARRHGTDGCRRSPWRRRYNSISLDSQAVAARPVRTVPARRQGRDRDRRERRVSAPGSRGCSTPRAHGWCSRPGAPNGWSSSRRELRDAHVVACDLSLDGAPESLVAATLAHYGRVDVLVNNAGTSEPTPAFDETTDKFAATLRVNLVAPFELARRMRAGDDRGGDGRHDRQRRVDLGTRRRRPDPRGGLRGVEGRVSST